MTLQFITEALRQRVRSALARALLDGAPPGITDNLTRASACLEAERVDLKPVLDALREFRRWRGGFVGDGG